MNGMKIGKILEFLDNFEKITTCSKLKESVSYELEKLGIR